MSTNLIPEPTVSRAIAEARTDMTVREAREILQHPKFGNKQCIEARRVLVDLEDVKLAREAWDWDPESTPYTMRFPHVSKMSTKEIRGGARFWRSRGWNGENFDV